MEAITAIIDLAKTLAEGNKDATGSTAYDLAYVFVEPWINIADGASQLLGMFV